MEGNITKIDVVNLASGSRARVVDYPLGNRSWDASQTSAGNVDITANYGLTNARKESVELLVPAVGAQASK